MLAIHAQGQIDYLRYNDNFSYLMADTIKKKGTEKLKYIPIASAVNISLGGELREQIQYYRNFNFGDITGATNRPETWQLWHRAMAHANIELGKNVRVFSQLNSTFRFLNPNPAIPEIDENHLSLHQLFGEYRFNNNWVVRIGRQEMSYGSHRLITFREGPNTRLAFDAAVIKYSIEKRKVDLMVLSPVISHKGVFDDGTLKDFIVGIYATELIVPRKLLVDYYLLNFESHRRKYNYMEGTDSRRVAGFRAFSQNKVVNYESEVTYQFGRFNNLRINAYSLSAELNIRVVAKKELVLGLAGNYVSGDKDNNDKQLNTYNTLFSKPLYGLTAPVGASNIITINPYLRARLAKKINILAGTYWLWRQSNRDGSYTPDGTEVRPRQDKLFATTEKKIGTLLIVETAYTVNKHFSVGIDGSQFFAGKFLAKTGKGKDISYLSLKVGYKF